jgi:malate dehydrogenase (oxaloacetate-decarboxylating)
MADLLQLEPDQFSWRSLFPDAVSPATYRSPAGCAMMAGMSEPPSSSDAVRGRPSGAGYTVTMRVMAPHDPTLLPRLAEVVSGAQGVVTGMDLVDVTTAGATVDLTLLALDEDHVHEVTAALEAQTGARVRHTSDPTFLYHLGGKIEVTARTPLRTRQDMSMAYTPGVGRVASAIAARPESAWTLTAKGSSVAIVTDGTAVLGLGDIGPLGALPVMEGKSLIFKEFAGLNAYPLCLNARDPQAVIDATLAIAPGFGGINLEDIAAPACFYVESELQRQLDIPVFHDDQHGTAVVVAAALLNACRITGRTFPHVRVVLIGCGAAGSAISTALLDAGVEDLVIVDKHGVLTEGASGLAHHRSLAERSNPRGVTDVASALKDADVFIGTARRGSVDPRLLEAMAPQPIVFALSNPEPELLPSEVRADALLATGRSDMPNQINNALCFPGFFRGALDVRASTVTLAMKQAATRAIADIVTDEQRGLGVIIPTMFQTRLHQAVARAVSDAWIAEHPQARRHEGGHPFDADLDFGLAALGSPIPSAIPSR